MAVHFNDRSMAELKEMLRPHIKRVILLTPPHPRGRREVVERFEQLWPWICAAHYDKGWPWMRIRDRLDSWMTRIILSVPIELDEEGTQRRWTRKPHHQLTSETEREGAKRPDIQIGYTGGNGRRPKGG